MEGEEEEKMGSVCVQENIPDWTVLYHLRGGVGNIYSVIVVWSCYDSSTECVNYQVESNQMEELSRFESVNTLVDE